MCGIAGIWNKSGAPVETAALRALADAMTHRGPDAGGIWKNGNLGFAHRRLKIIDLSDAANQPFFDNEAVLVFNGEIFNFAELRNHLEKWFPFRTSSDTEVLFHALKHWGRDVFSHLEGQYAFAFFDVRKRTLLLARDHVGICPLYFFEDETRLMFASEIKALLRLVRPRLDNAGLVDYLAYRYNIQNGRTMFQGFRRFPPAHWQEHCLMSGSQKSGRYWRLAFADGLSGEANPGDLHEILDREIKQQCLADVPVGLYLSGGIDSGAILHGFAKNLASIRSFTVTFGNDDPELMRVRELGRLYKFQENPLPFGRKCFTDVEDIFRSVEEPFGDLIIGVNHFLAQQASKSVKVVLSGEGGDEAFLGYDHQRGFLKMLPFHGSGLLRRMGKIALDWLPPSILARVNNYPGRFEATEQKRVSRVLQQMSHPADAYISMIRLFSDHEIKELLQPRLRKQVPMNPDQTTIREAFSHDPHIWQSLIRVEIEQLTLVINLLKQERFGMRFGLESRVPLVGRRVLEHVGQLPASVLLRGLAKQPLLDYSQTSQRIQKRAFSVLNSEVFPKVRTHLLEKYASEEAVNDGGILSWSYASRFLAPSGNQGFLEEKKTMALLSFLIWHRSFQNDISS